MTQKDKQLLLLKDLCARLPYELKGRDCSGKTRQMVVIYDTGTILAHEIDGENCGACGFVPYLRPMSSMTKEEEEEYWQIRCPQYDENGKIINKDTEIFDWLNKKMFDYRGLIEKGFALEAPEGMYNI